MLLDRDHRSGQGHLDPGVEPGDQLNAVHGDLDLVHLAARVGDLQLAGGLAAAVILRHCFQIGGIDNPGDVGLEDPGRRPRLDDPIEQDLQGAHVHFDDVVGQGIRAHGPCGTRFLPCGGASRAHPLLRLLGLEAHQAPEGLITKQQRWQASSLSIPNRVFKL